MLLLGLAFGLGIGFAISYFPGTSKKKDGPPSVTPAPSTPEPGLLREELPEFDTNRVLAVFATEEELYVSYHGMGVARTRDGATFDPLRIGMVDPKEARSIVQVKPTRESIAAALMDAGLGQGGEPDLAAMEDAIKGVAAMTPGIVAGMADGRVLRLDGDQWKELARLPAEGGGVFRLRYEPAVGLAACTGRGLYLSTDGGSTWTQAVADPLVRDVILSPGASNRYVIATYGNGLKRCSAAGSCTAVKGLPALVRSLSGSAYGAQGFVGTDGDGVWSFDGGAVKQEVSGALMNADILDIVHVGARVLAAAGPDGFWIRHAPDSGWLPGRGLPPDSVTAVALFGGRIFVGTNRYGLFSAPLKGGDFVSVP
ncbi:MAG: hypothetical protein M5R36_07965 [Deltaproteobacteria bacterium]|nr:hypothetical protein [Deltaproteobacteria bacterium]